MIVTLAMPDGSEQNVDVTNIRIMLDSAPLDLSMASSQRLDLRSPYDDEETWHQSAIFPGAANVVGIELFKRVGRKTS